MNKIKQIMEAYSFFNLHCRKRFPTELKWKPLYLNGEIGEPLFYGVPGNTHLLKLCILSPKESKTIKDIIYLLKLEFEYPQS